ncbi:MAG: DNA polymerase domain-containing protein, partial [Chloroflexota bacterium]
PIALDGVFEWIAFLGSRRDSRVPVPNRYFGYNRSAKEIKVRGIELRRRDTPPFVCQLQEEMLEVMSGLFIKDSFDRCVEKLWELILNTADLLKGLKIPAEDLLVHHRLSRELDRYRSPSSGAKAAMLLRDHGKERQPGQIIKFVHLRDGNVHPWDLGGAPKPSTVDVSRYLKLMIRAASNVMQPLGINEDLIQRRVSGAGFQRSLFPTYI